MVSVQATPSYAEFWGSSFRPRTAPLRVQQIDLTWIVPCLLIFLSLQLILRDLILRSATAGRPCRVFVLYVCKAGASVSQTLPLLLGSMVSSLASTGLGQCGRPFSLADGPFSGLVWLASSWTCLSGLCAPMYDLRLVLCIVLGYCLVCCGLSRCSDCPPFRARFGCITACMRCRNLAVLHSVSHTTFHHSATAHAPIAPPLVAYYIA